MILFFFEVTLTGPLRTAAFLVWLIGCAVVFFWLAGHDWPTACLAAFSWVPMLWSLLALDEVHSRVDDLGKATLPAVWQSGFRSGTGGMPQVPDPGKRVTSAPRDFEVVLGVN